MDITAHSLPPRPTVTFCMRSIKLDERSFELGERDASLVCRMMSKQIAGNMNNASRTFCARGVHFESRWNGLRVEYMLRVHMS